MRNPANRVVIELEQRVSLFKGRIDAISKTLSKNSSLLFTANQVRQFVKVFLTGNWKLGSVIFEKTAHEILDVGEGVFDRELSKATDFVNFLADRIPVWHKISHLPVGGTTAAQIRDERQKGYVCLTAVGLIVIARIGHDLFKEDGVDWKPYADKLGDLDWKMSGSLWQGNIVTDGKLFGQNSFMQTATRNVRDAIGLSQPVEAESSTMPGKMLELLNSI